MHIRFTHAGLTNPSILLLLHIDRNDKEKTK